MIYVCRAKNRTVPSNISATRPSMIERHAQNRHRLSELQTKTMLARRQRWERAEKALIRLYASQTIAMSNEDFDEFVELLDRPFDTSKLTALVSRPPVWA